jgi:hypothetical protein
VRNIKKNEPKKVNPLVRIEEVQRNAPPPKVISYTNSSRRPELRQQVMLM